MLMIHRILKIGVSLALSFVGLFSCSVEDEYTENGLENYNALWTILDERYAYFDLKLPEGTTWRDLYNKYRPEVREKMSSDSLFLVMNKLMAELKDGHVNLSTPFDYGRYWRWHEDYPKNYDATLIDDYLGNDYRIAGGLLYTQLKHNNHAADSIAYLRFASFSSPLSSSNLNASLSRLAKCKAIILDIRNNGGGNVTTSDLFASHFMSEARVVGSMRHKVGRGHNDFSSPVELKVEPVANGLRWLRPVVLLTNRGVYSAANDFTLRMKGLPYVTVIGDKTGGGGGMPMSSELPNGWGIRYSATQTFDTEGKHIEFGIEPDYYVSLDKEKALQGEDTMVEYAITYINDRLAEYKQTKKWRR